MKICVVGCGAVGSIFAAHLAKAGDAEVYALDVAREHIQAIQQHGLHISGAAEFTVPLKASSEVRDLPRCDFGIVATKSIHTRLAIQNAAALFADGAVCSVQNGV